MLVKDILSFKENEKVENEICNFSSYKTETKRERRRLVNEILNSNICFGTYHSFVFDNIPKKVQGFLVIELKTPTTKKVCINFISFLKKKRNKWFRENNFAIQNEEGALFVYLNEMASHTFYKEVNFNIINEEEYKKIKSKVANNLSYDYLKE